MRFAVIPARGGSKRIPGKNIWSFHGRPIIEWSLTTAIASKLFDRVIVSTDDLAIAAEAKRVGAEVPFMRPEDISDDHATTLDVMQHAVEWFVDHDMRPSSVCCVYPTAPFVRSVDLERGLVQLESSDVDYVFPVTTFSFPIQRALKRDEEGRVSLFHPEHEKTRSQDLEEAWHDAGQFYWGTASAFLEKRPLMSGRSIGIELPRERVQDIDTEEDWRLAELMFAALIARDR